MLFCILKVQRTKLKASHDKDYWLCAIDMKRSSWDTYSYVYFLCIKMYSDSLLYVIVESVCDKKKFSYTWAYCPNFFIGYDWNRLKLHCILKLQKMLACFLHFLFFPLLRLWVAVVQVTTALCKWKTGKVLQKLKNIFT